MPDLVPEQYKREVISVGKPASPLSGGRRKNVRRLVAVLIALVLLLTIGAIANRYFGGEERGGVSQILKSNKKKDTRIESKLDGTLTEPAQAARNPLAVVIENHTDARPQSGLTEASIVFEAIAEGGITRFLAIYGPRDAEKVGPIRSARTYFVDWTLGLGAYMAHVGGNIDALDQIRADDVLDLDQFANGRSYHREPKAGIATEHTMYSDTQTLFALGEEKYGAQQNFDAYTFKKPLDENKRPIGSSITINFSAPSYKVEYDYSQKENVYERSMAGVPHVDAGAAGKQIAPTVVAVITVQGQSGLTRINEQGWTYTTVGSGKATVFQDGVVTQGTWKKTSKKERIKFFEEAGKEISFNAGQMWIEVISPGASYTFEEGTIATPETK